MGLGNGIFMSPNMASVMNSCPAREQRRSIRHALNTAERGPNHQPSHILQHNHHLAKRFSTCSALIRSR